jgi:hypothetical protein
MIGIAPDMSDLPILFDDGDATGVVTIARARGENGFFHGLMDYPMNGFFPLAAALKDANEKAPITYSVLLSPKGLCDGVAQGLAFLISSGPERSCARSSRDLRDSCSR